MDQISCRVPNTVAAVTAAIDRVRGALEQAGVSMPAIFDVELALEELLVNVVNHGGLVEGQAEIELQVTLAAETIHIVIDDPGGEFNPLHGPQPDLEKPLPERPIGGLGLHLVRSKAQRFTYERRGEKNHQELWFARNPTPAN